MYFENFFSNKLFNEFLKKNTAIKYKDNAPVEIDKTEMKVPIHLPNKIPETIKSGDPNPSKATHIIQNKKNKKRFKKRLLLIDFSRFVCKSL